MEALGWIVWIILGAIVCGAILAALAMDDYPPTK